MTRTLTRRPRPLVVTVLSLATVSVACGRDTAGTGDLSGIVISVTLQPARLATMHDTARFDGAVVPAAGADFVATAPRSAVVAEVPDEGQLVTAGAVLVKFELPEVAAELALRQADVTAASTSVDTARAEADRVSALYQQGLAARNQYEAARAALDAAESALAQARASLEAAKAVDAGSAIRAPFTGVVQKRHHAAGDIVSGVDDPILRLIDPTRVQVIVRVATDQAARVLPGQAATVHSALGEAMAAVARKSAPEESPVTTEIRLDFAAPATLTVDTEVQVEIVLEVRPNVVAVPVAAVQRPENGPAFVWLATEDDVALRQEVQVGLVANGLAQILSGVVVDDQVIVTGIAQLTDGAAIQR